MARQRGAGSSDDYHSGSSDDYHSGSEGPFGMSSAPRDDIDGLLNTPGAFSTNSHPDSRGPPSSMRSVDVDEEHGEDELEDLGSFKPSPLNDRFEEEFFESVSRGNPRAVPLQPHYQRRPCALSLSLDVHHPPVPSTRALEFDEPNPISRVECRCEFFPRA